MDGDLGAMLESVLSDPEQMGKIAQMAKGLMGQSDGGSQPEDGAAPAEALAAAPALSGGEAKLLSALGKAFAGGGGKTRSTELLMAMRPYMRPEKQDKLDRAMKLARMARIAGAVMQEYGGGGHGI